MNRLHSRFLVTLLLSIPLTVQAGSDPIKEGYSAFKREAWDEAYRLWLPEVERGDARAQFYLNTLFSFGLGREKDEAQAFELLSLSAESDFAPAQYALGSSYKNGRYVERDIKRAVYWWKKSAKQGFARAQYSLGILHYLGKGVKKDRKKAITWYRRAALAGSFQAKQTLKRLNIPLRPESLGEPVAVKFEPLQAVTESPKVIESAAQKMQKAQVAGADSKPPEKIVYKDSDFDSFAAVEKRGLNLNFTADDYDGLSRRSDTEQSDAMRSMASKILGQGEVGEGSGGGSLPQKEAPAVKVEPIEKPDDLVTATLVVTLPPQDTEEPLAAVVDFTEEMNAPGDTGEEVAEVAGDSTRSTPEAEVAVPIAEEEAVGEPEPQLSDSPNSELTSVMKIEAEEENPSYIRGHVWIEEQQSDHYTLQLFSSNKQTSAENFLKLLKSEWPRAIFRFKRSDGARWYGVIVGSFPGFTVAKEAAVGFSAGRGESIAWIRDFGGIQQTLLK